MQLIHDFVSLTGHSPLSTLGGAYSWVVESFNSFNESWYDMLSVLGIPIGM
jgi:hypothetical protein